MTWLVEKLLPMLFPQRTVCHACGAPLTAGEALLCRTCAQSLRQSAYPEKRMPAPVGECVSFAASAFAYRDAAAALVKALKFSSDRTAALPLAERMAGVYAACPALREAQLCIAVPVHPKRLRQRGYNQAEILACAFSEITGVPITGNVLLRIHHKHSQVGQGREARRLNIAGAFAVSRKGAPLIAGRQVLLIDDVLTTGATVEECARELLLAGAENVLVLTAARA
ncbi:MAG: phosphoribosyltransferase family protein [Eubacteriales bacterium]|nr:phosphoribosyltransferase family protein [Eubacteriales bacterium]